MNSPETANCGPTSPARNAGIGVVIFLVLFGLPFACFGLSALVSGIRILASGTIANGLAPILFGVVFSGIGFLMIFGAIWAQRKMNRYAALKARFPDQPWMVRQDWADGKIKAAYSAPIWFILFWAFVALACSAPALFQIPREWQKRQSRPPRHPHFPRCCVCPARILVWPMAGAPSPRQLFF